MNYKTSFSKYKDKFELVENKDIFAIYKRTRSNAESFETVIFYVNDEGERFYPGSTSWGQRGWSYPTYEGAKARYEQVMTTKQNLVSASR